MRLPPSYIAKAAVYALLIGGVLLAMKTQDHYADIAPYWRKLHDIRRVQPRTVFLGSSRTMRHVDPVRLDSIQGNRALSYNFGIPGSRYLETHFRTDHLLEMEMSSLERVVVEFGPIAVGVPEQAGATRRNQHYHDLRRARIGSGIAMASERPLRRRLTAAGNRWRYWTMNTFLVGWGRAWTNAVLTERVLTERYRPVGRRGFVGLEQSENASTRARHHDYLSPEGQAELSRRVVAIRKRRAYVPTARDTISADAWLALAERARARGVQVVFIEQVGTENGAGVTALVRDALGEDAVIVLNDPDLYPEFFDAEAWFDVGHLHGSMAAQATDILSRKLAPLPPR